MHKPESLTILERLTASNEVANLLTEDVITGLSRAQETTRKDIDRIVSVASAVANALALVASQLQAANLIALANTSEGNLTKRVRV